MDRDPVFTQEVRTRVEHAGSEPVRLPRRSPNLTEAWIPALDGVEERPHQGLVGNLVAAATRPAARAVSCGVNGSAGFSITTTANQRERGDDSVLPHYALKMVTYDNAELVKICGPRDAYPGELGVVKEGALADLLLVAGNPLENFDLVADPDKNFVMIMKDGEIYKNTIK